MVADVNDGIDEHDASMKEGGRETEKDVHIIECHRPRVFHNHLALSKLTAATRLQARRIATRTVMFLSFQFGKSDTLCQKTPRTQSPLYCIDLPDTTFP